MTYDPRAGLGPMHHEDPERYIDGPDHGDVIPGTEYEPGGMYDGYADPCPSACSVCGPDGCDPACQVCAAENAAYEAHLAATDHDCPREVFVNDPITRAYGESGMAGLVPCAVCDAEAGR
jgi:hypothetical protein